MSVPRRSYQLHAEISGAGPARAGLDDERAGHPLERRLNRIERAAAAFGGEIDARWNEGLCMAFETADTALLAAREMQSRCALLPQAAGNRLALRIGIHRSAVRQRSRDGVDNAREIAAQLAVADDGIVASGGVVAALAPELRKLARPLTELAGELAAHAIEWRAATDGDTRAAVRKQAPRISPFLLLHHGLQTLELTRENPLLTIGRDAENDLALDGDHVSRNHCRIERRADGIFLTDTSTNGTSVTRGEGVELLLRNNSVELKGKGMLFLGRLCNGDRRGGISYEVR